MPEEAGTRKDTFVWVENFNEMNFSLLNVSIMTLTRNNSRILF